MAEIKNIEGLSSDQIYYELSNGGKFVMFEYCISIVLMTFKRSSDIYLIRSGESTLKHSIGFSLLTFVLGWWGLPWGPIYTIGSLYTNITGGKDITKEVLDSLERQYIGDALEK